MSSSLFSLAFRAIVHYSFKHLESPSFRVFDVQSQSSSSVSFRVTIPRYSHSLALQILAFMASLLLSFSSLCYPVLIAYSSLSFHISLLTIHDAVLRVHDTYFCHVVGHPILIIFMWFTQDSLLRAHSFPYFKVVRPLLILDMVFRVISGDVLEGTWILSVASDTF